MKKITLLIIVSIMTLTSSFPLFAEETCQTIHKADAKTTTNNSKCIPSPECPLKETMFNFTRAKTTFMNIKGTKVYLIEQNEDSRYNVGYSYGKSVMLNDPDYARNLREYLDRFIEKQSQYQLIDIVKRISNSLPCWLKEEFKGFTAAINTNNECLRFTYHDVVLLNTVVLWTKIPKKPPIAPPAAPISINPIEKEDLINLDLSPVSEISEEVSFYSYLASEFSETENAFAIRTYKRSYESFFDNVAAVLIYKLDHSSFINVGFEGIIASLSGINQYGIVLNTIQDPDQTNIRIIGASPPTIPIRIALEHAKNKEQAQTILDNYKSSIEQVFTIADKSQNIFINTGTQDDEIRGIKEISNEKQSVIYNVLKENIEQKSLTRLFKLINLNHKINISRVLKGLRRGFIVNTNKNKDGLKDVFRVLYIPEQKQAYVLMPPEIQDNVLLNKTKTKYSNFSTNKPQVAKEENKETLSENSLIKKENNINETNNIEQIIHFIKIDLKDYIVSNKKTNSEKDSSLKHLYNYLEEK